MPSGSRYASVNSSIFCLAAVSLIALAAEASAREAADYFVLSPCRIYDTRTPVHDPLRGGPDRRRDIQVSGVCGVPAEAVAVALNLTAVNASRAGSLSVYDADLASAPMPYSALELLPGRTRANNAIVGLSADGKIAAELAADFTAADTVDLVVDVAGYFVENEPPTAAADEATVEQDSAGNAIDVLANDTDPDGGMKLVTAVDTTGTLGSVVITGGGTGVSYTPAPGNCNTPPDTDTFEYTITGGSTAQVAVHVLCTEIRIVKSTNGEDANTPPGPAIAQGAPILWEYFVSNTGSVALSNIMVTDDRGVAVFCPKTSLQAGESMRCTGSGTSQGCPYSNVGTATGRTPGGRTVSDDDPSHYTGTAQPSITLTKSTNGQDANTPPGPAIPVGSPVSWTYRATNTGNSSLSNVRITDNMGVAVFCPKTSLAAGESMTCTGNGTAVEGQYSNIGTVTGTSLCGSVVTDDDPSHYFGTLPLSLITRTNDQDANTPPGPEIPAGSPVLWTYRVSNTGGGALTNIRVTDNQGVAVSCPKTTLQPGESMTCTGNGTAMACQYSNVGTATGTTQGGSMVTAQDPSHYFGTPCP